MTGPANPSASPPRQGGGLGLASRLMLAQVVVLVSAVGAAVVAAAVVGPPIFERHLLEAGQGPNAAELAHAKQAYSDANSAALIAAVLVALVCATAVSWYAARRITRPLHGLAGVAAAVSAGDYTVRASRTGAGPELDALAATFNDVVARLEETEDTRRRLLSDLAHEMRTPLATLRARIEGLEDEVVAWTPDTGRVLREQTSRLERLADDLSEVSRAEEHRLDLHPVPVPVADLLWSAAQASAEAFGAKGVRLVAPAHEGGAPGGAVLADPDRVQQVLGNVLANALRHTPPGGTVTLAAYDDGAAVDISVTDTGEGIDPAQLPHVFDRFYRGDTARVRDQGGSGIGLTIARSIAVAHGGRLTAESAGLGRGARFVLTLPVAR